MKYSKLFGKTLKNFPKDAVFRSHQLLYKAGFIRESTAGRYYLLPLGLRVQQKIQKIIKDEMDNAGAQEMIAPFMHPKEIWKETNRTDSVGFELMTIKDRSEAEFVLGGTAEEMLVDLVRKFQISYKDLPFNLYQFSMKFRDELRPRGGLLRLREFVMKDAYSFHVTEQDFKREYEVMKKTYSSIFQRLGLKTLIVESDNGYIGGEYCHEFVVEDKIGESHFVSDSSSNYYSHVEIAGFKREDENSFEEQKAITKVKSIRGNSIEEGVKFHGLPAWRQMKSVLMIDEKGRYILAVIRGDLEVNEVKLTRAVRAYTLRRANEEEIEKIKSVPGFISPVGLKEKQNKDIEIIIVCDSSIRLTRNMYTGANMKNEDYLNVNLDRDFHADLESDIGLVKEGYKSSDNQKLTLKKGIEVGNIFQLGYYYSRKMKGAEFTDDQGNKKPYYMGCYGIGLARTMAAIVEKSNDAKGIIWPLSVSPFVIHLINVDFQTKADEIYNKLRNAGISVLYDDRNVSMGIKFADCDLIGIPFRLVISSKNPEKVELKKRTEDKVQLITMDEVLNFIRNLI